MLEKLKSAKDHQGFMRYFKNTSWLFLEKILRIIASLSVGIWVARYLGPEQFGQLSYAMSLVWIFSSIATFGLDVIVIRELVKDRGRRDELIGTAFWLKLIGAFLVLLILFVVINFLSSDHYINTLIFIIASATIFQSFNVVDMYFQSEVMSKYVVYANSLSLVLSSVLKVVLVLTGAPLVAFAWVILFDSIVLASGLMYFYVTRKKTERDIEHRKLFSWRLKKVAAINLLADSWPIMLSGMLTTLYMKIDQVMINEMLGSKAVGEYAAAVKLSEAWYFIPVIIVSSLFPAIVNTKKSSEDLYNSRFQNLYTLMVWLSIAIAIPVTFLSGPASTLLYGDQYSEVGDILMIHIWSGIFVFTGVAGVKWLVAEGLQIFSTINTAIGAIVNISLNYVLIDKIGVEGAAWATLISYFVAGYLSLVFFRKTRINFFNISKSIFPMIK